jgi:membrane protein DedA with SNARE-associated domain
MTDSPPLTTLKEAPQPHRSRRRRVIAIVALCGFVALLIWLNFVERESIVGLIDAESDTWQYLAVFFLIVGDAIIPIFPGETTLNAASTLAAQGDLELGLVMLAGALGAIVGDSCLYWIARSNAGLVAPRLEAARGNPKVAVGLNALKGKGAPVLLVAGRYVMGLRFVVNATMGLEAYPYRKFLLWSSVGGISWSIYTCTMSYWVASALAGFPIGSIVISGIITTAILAAGYVVYRRSSAATGTGEGELAGTDT